MSSSQSMWEYNEHEIEKLRLKALISLIPELRVDRWGELKTWDLRLEVSLRPRVMQRIGEWECVLGSDWVHLWERGDGEQRAKRGLGSTESERALKIEEWIGLRTEIV